MILTIVALITIASLFALAVVIRDIGREISGLDESGKSEAQRREEKLKREIDAWRKGK